MDVFALTATLSLQADNFFSGLADAAEAMLQFAEDSVKVGAGFDKSMSQVGAVTGASADEFDLLRKKALEAGLSTMFTAEESANALYYMGLAGWDVNEALQGLDGVLNLAAASGSDLARTSDIVTDAMTAFKMEASEAAHFADILAAASTNTNTTVDMMGESFKYASSIAGALGYSAEDTAIALGLMADVGIKASQGGTALRRFLLSTSSLSGEIEILGDAFPEIRDGVNGIKIATTKADGSMRELRDIIVDMRAAYSQLTETEKSFNAEQLAGKTGMAGMMAVLDASVDDWNKVVYAIDHASFTVDGFIENCTKAGLSLYSMRERLSEVGITADEFTIALEKSNGNAESFADYLQEAADNGTSFGEICEALGISLEDLQKIMDETGNASKRMAERVMDNLWGDLREWNSAVEGFQIALSDKLTPTLREFVSFGTERLQAFTRAFREDGLDGAIEVFGKFVEDGSNMIQEKLPEFQEKGTKILNAISKGIEVASPTISLVIGTLGNMVGEFLQQNAPTITSTVTTLVSSMTPGIVAALKGVFAGVKESWPTIWSGIQDVAGEAINGIVDLVKEANPLIGGILERLVEDLGKAAETEKNVQKALSQGTEELVSNLDKNKNWLENTVDLFKIGMQNFADNMEDSMAKASDSVTNATSAISGGADDASSSLAELKNYVLDNYDAYGTFNDYITENATNALNALLPLADRDGDGYVTSSDHIDGTSTPAQKAYEMLMTLFTTDGEGNLTYSEHNALNAITVIEQVLKLIDQIKAEDGYTSHTASVHDVYTNYYTNGEKTGVGATENAQNKIDKLQDKVDKNRVVNARSMFGGTILQGATMFGWDAQGRPQIGGGEGPEAVVGVNSLNEQIRSAVRDGLSGIVGAIAQAVGGRNEQPVYVVLDTGELVGAIGGKMDAELGKIGDWKGGGRA